MVERLDDRLRALGSADGVPALGSELEAAIADMGSVRTRRPMWQWGAIAAVSLAYAAGLVWFFDVRRDLGGLPRAWVVVYATAWLLGFCAFTFIAVVPRRGDVMPRWRAAAIAAAVGGVAFPAAGLLFATHVPGQSILADASVRQFAAYSQWCTEWGLITALVPVALCAVVLRGAVPVQSRWVGAAIGAAGGCLGGLMLHFHCPIADRFHVGLVHGGVVAIGALVAAVVVPRVAR